MSHSQRVMKRGLTAVIGLALAATFTVASSAGASSEDDSVHEVPAAVNNPRISAEVIESLPAVLQQDDTLYIDESYEAGTPIVYPDGEAVPGQSKEALTYAAANCGGSAYGPPYGSWGAVGYGSCGIVGHNGYQKYYSWNRSHNVDTTGCVKVRGYKQSLPPYVTNDAYWAYAGCGTSGSKTVSWGNVLSKPAAQAASQGGLGGFWAAFS